MQTKLQNIKPCIWAGGRRYKQPRKTIIEINHVTVDGMFKHILSIVFIFITIVTDAWSTYICIGAHALRLILVTFQKLKCCIENCQICRNLMSLLLVATQVHLASHVSTFKFFILIL